MRPVQIVRALAAGCIGLSGICSAQAAPCANPEAIGTSRILVVDPTEHPRLGTMQYPETLPLKDHEVVLTFDDGPLPPNTSRILDTLAEQCVKATYFLVGEMAKTYPKLVRRIYEEGHTIGTHSLDHPFTFRKMPIEKAEHEINGGIALVQAALGPDKPIAPFFRIPGLLRANAVEDYLATRGIETWSADFPADDWKHISAKEVVRRALTRLEAHGKGILLLHDIHPNTAAALPVLLHELKVRGYHIVQVVPATPERPKTPTEPGDWLMHPAPAPVAPALIDVSAIGVIPGLPVTSDYGPGDHVFEKALLIPLGGNSPVFRGRKAKRHAVPDTAAWAGGHGIFTHEKDASAFEFPSPGPQLFQELMLTEPVPTPPTRPRRPTRVAAHTQLPRIAAKPLPLPSARPDIPEPPVPVPAAAAVPQPKQSRSGLLPALFAHLWPGR